MSDKKKIARAEAILNLASGKGEDLTPEMEEVWDRALGHVQDGRAHLALVEANKLAALMGIVPER